MSIVTKDKLDITLVSDGNVTEVEVEVGEKLRIFNDDSPNIYYQFENNLERKWIPLPPNNAIRVSQNVFMRNQTRNIVVLATDRICNAV